MESRVMEITPKIAEDFLRRNACNRKINDGRVRFYASEMVNGNWYLHHQGIGIFEDGNILDGQHRLKAIVMSGCSIDMLVTTGIAKESALGVDDHKPRSIDDIIKIGTGNDWFNKDRVAVIRSVLMVGFRGINKISADMLLKLTTNEVMERVDFSIGNINKKYGDAAVKAAVSMAYGIEKTDRLIEFCNALNTGMISNELDVAAIRFRDYLVNRSSHSFSARIDTVMRGQRAIKAFCDYQKISKLYAPASLIYEPYISMSMVLQQMRTTGAGIAAHS